MGLANDMVLEERSPDVNTFLSSKDQIMKTNLLAQSVMRQAADRLGWTDSEVARLAGLPQSTVYRALNAKTVNPSFGIIHHLCSVLGVRLPFENEGFTHTASVQMYIGNSTLGLISKGRKEEYVQILPEFKNCIIGKVIDGCANRRFPKGSILFIDGFAKSNFPLKLNDIVIVRHSKNGAGSLLPMIVLESAESAEWILSHLTNNVDSQYIFTIDKSCTQVNKNGHTIELLGLINKALV